MNEQCNRGAVRTPNFASRLVGGILLFAMGCERPEEPQDHITLAYQTWVGYSPLFLAEMKGFYADEALDVTFVNDELAPARRDAFKQGILDVSTETLDLLGSARAADTPAVGVMVLDVSLGGDGIVADKQIECVKDLAGKKVAYARENVGEVFLAYVLHKEGLSLNDVDPTFLAPENAGAAFVAGKVDAAVTWEPWISQAQKHSNAHLLVSTREEPGFIVDILAAREAFARERPEALKKLMRAWYRAVSWHKAHPEEAARMLAPRFDISPQDYLETLEGLHWPDYEGTLEHFGTTAVPGRIFAVFDQIADLKRTYRLIPPVPLSSSDALDPAYLQSLYDDPLDQP